ncbi:MAG TPA: PIN domain-containing protein [Solirubrobacterales bacterium]
MRTLLDANALVAVILGELAMGPVRSLLREGDAAMTAPNIVEVYDIAARREGLPVDRVAEVVEPLFGGTIEQVVVDASLARRAAEIRIEHYHRKTRRLSLADVILLAAARPVDKIASSDSDVLAIAAKLGIETIELPASAG